MKMKKYTAATMVEAMKRVRMDFGDDAVILSSNVVKTKGFLGLFKKKSVEVVAGFDEPTKTYAAPVRDDSAQTSFIESRVSVEMKKEMLEMKKMLKTMQYSTNTDLSSFPNDMQPLLAHLQQQDISLAYVTQLGEALFSEMKSQKRDFTLDEQKEFIRHSIIKTIGNLPFGGISFTKKYINVLGPTGVGKTTTIAKVAARALLEQKKKVGFITTDTYRIAAIEQLRTYANLLQAPVEIAYNSADFAKAIEKLADRDLIFIDTAGRNYKEQKYVDDLSNLIDFSLDMESYLVLSMTSKENDMRTIIQQFNAFPIEKFIFTKMDETDSIGPLFNLMNEYKIGTAYYTDGQEVPEDITEATLEKLVSILLAGVPHA